MGSFSSSVQCWCKASCSLDISALYSSPARQKAIDTIKINFLKTTLDGIHLYIGMSYETKYMIFKLIQHNTSGYCFKTRTTRSYW